MRNILKIKHGLILGFLLIFVFNACKKTEDVIIPDNKVPYHEGVTTIQVQNYVNKAYIDITGAEPDIANRDNWVNTLKTNKLDVATRADFVDALFQSADYTKQFDNIFLAPMFGGAYDTVAIRNQINELSYFRSLAVANGDSALSQFWAYEISKMTLVLTASGQYHGGQITLNEAKRRLANNYIYDQINMGTTNFVIACFENFLKRLPTELEQSNSETMVNGQSARIFMRDGSTKGDFLAIMTSTSGFYEGVVIDTYLHLLARLPNSTEMGWNTADLENNAIDVNDLIRNVAISEEYAGF